MLIILKYYFLFSIISVGVSLLYFVVVMQVFVVLERVLYHTICIVIQGKRPPMKQLTDKGVLAAVFAALAETLAVIFGVIMTFINVFVRNLGLVLSVVILGTLIAIVGGGAKEVIALAVNVYNSGVGILANTFIVKPVQVAYILLTPLIVLYNGAVWFLGQIAVRVLLPILEVNAGAIPDLVESVGKGSAGMSFSLNTFLVRVLECSNTASASTAIDAQVPYTAANLHCVANDNYLQIDLMTPGAFSRKAAEAIFLLLSAGCSPLIPILEIGWFPFLDFNFYSFIHNSVNFIVELLVLPLKTWKLCSFGKSGAEPSYTDTDKVVMCTPDFTHAYGLLTRSILALGKLIDNWLDVAYNVVERHSSVDPSAIAKCAPYTPVAQLRADVSKLASFDSPSNRESRIVGMDGLIAVTDGASTMFWNGQHSMYGLEHWPVEVDASLGVAAVHFYGEGTRSALFGCSCIDAPDAGIESMRVQCASVPFEADSLNRTLHEVTLPSIGLTCATARIEVHSLRFSRARFSRELGRGFDVSQTENVLSDKSGKNEIDAVVFVAPRCPIIGEVPPSCIRNARNCFPYCLGVRVSGQRNRVIELLNARVWRENVQFRETDCALNRDERTCTQGDGTIVSSPTMLDHAAQEEYMASCTFSSSQCVEEPLAVSRVPLDSVGANPHQHGVPTLTLSDQPLVVAGDTMLFRQDNDGTIGLRVLRMRSSERGLRQENIQMSENNVNFPVVECNVDTDISGSVDRDEISLSNTCVVEALNTNSVMLPFAYQIDTAPRPAALSRWAVHWAVNSELAVLDALFSQCQGDSSTGLVVLSSVRRPRVWTLKTARATFAMGTAQPAESAGVSFFTIPNAIKDGTACRAVVNFQVESMEFIDDANILVTTKASSAFTWPHEFEYRHYYLHPNRADCFGDESSEAIFSCWREVSKGPFVLDTGRAPLIAGQLCPALQRMPKLGSAGAEIFAASADATLLLLHAITVGPALSAAGLGIADVFTTRTVPTYHSVLDSSGNALLDIDSVLMHIDAGLAHTWNTLGIFADLLRGRPGHAVVEGVLVGTAKVKQYAYEGANLFSDPLLAKLKKVTAAPTGKLLDSVRGMLVQNPFERMGFKPPAFVAQIQRVTAGSMSSLRANARVMRRFLKSMLRVRKNVETATTVSRFVSSDVLGRFADDLQAEISDSLSDIMRLQCDGYATIFGLHNPWARTVRSACAVVPAAVDSVLDIFSVLVSVYPTVACVCKLGELDTGSARNECVTRVHSLAAQSWTKGVSTDLTTQQGQCFSAMDIANSRLQKAFDPFFAETQRLIDSIPPSIDYMTRVFDVDAGQCTQQSAYVVSIMPEPVDYFMGCTHTSMCRTRCLANIVAFENALAFLITKPTFTRVENLVVRSKFFSSEDVEQERHRPPFDVRAIAGALQSSSDEIPSECAIPVVIAGLAGGGIYSELGNTPAVRSQRFCAPRDVTTFVSAVGDHITFPAIQNDDNADGLYATLQEMHWMVPAWREADQKLVTLTRVGELQRISLLTLGLSLTLFQTETWDPRLYDHNAKPNDDAYTVQEINRVRVLPISPTTTQGVMYMIGTRMEAVNANQTGMYTADGMRINHGFKATPVCLRLVVSLSNSEDFIATTRSVCDPAVAPADVAVVCATVDCLSEVLLPRLPKRDLTVRAVDHTAAFTVTSSSTRKAAPGLAREIGLQPRRPLYLTASGAAASNVRRVAPAALETPSDKLSVLFAGAGARESWLQLAVVGLSESQTNSASIGASVQQSVTATFEIECSLDNCVGCQTTPPTPAYADVQAKCWAAQQCALTRCVGTPVNLGRPLCNIGAALAKSYDMANVGAQGLWLALSRTVILTVELSAARREVYEIAWPENAFMSAVCTAKDSFVESSAVLTSVVGASALTVQRGAGDLGIRTAMSDARWRAKFFMGLQAITRLLANIAMVPIYGAIAAQKTATCLTNDVIMLFQNAVDAEASLTVRIGSRAVQERAEQNSGSGTQVGVCLSALVGERLREAGMQDLREISEVAAFISEAGDLTRRIPLEPLSHGLDAALAYSIGVVNGVMDVAQTLDFERCKLPDVTRQRTDECVCGDTPVKISGPRRESKEGSALWCTGPLMLTGSTGDAELVWNPYSFDELVADSADFEAYLQCLTAPDECPPDDESSASLRRTVAGRRSSSKVAALASAVEIAGRLYSENTESTSPISESEKIARVKCAAGCDFLRPSLPNLEQQGAHLMQVVARCRSNFQAKQWDSGAAVLGVFSKAQWDAVRELKTAEEVKIVGEEQNGPSEPSGRDAYDATRAHLISLASVMASSPFPASDDTLACLRARLGESGAQFDCMYTVMGPSVLERYFEYEQHASVSIQFANADACEAFSGSDISTTGLSGAALPRFIWAGSSTNKEPVATFHEKSSGQDRLVAAESEIQDLYSKIDLFLADVPDLTASNIKVAALLQDGDDVHQLVDCIVLGPYAAADLHVTPPGTSARRAPQQYHRGNATSREFLGGSQPRKNLMRAVGDHISTSLPAATVATAQHLWRTVVGAWRDPAALKCTCKTSSGSSLACCADYDNIASIHFRAQDVLQPNMHADVMSTVMQSLIDDKIVSEKLWRDPAFTPTPIYATQDDQYLFRDAGLFKSNERVVSYGIEETVNGEQMRVFEPLWKHCVDLLEGGFFTMPIDKTSASSPIDRVSDYNPGSDNSDAWLHAQEGVIARILNESRHTVPVFWTHQHRYIPSDSAWCEDTTADPTHGPTVNTITTTRDVAGITDAVEAQTVLAPRLEDVEFPGSTNMCVCGLKTTDDVCDFAGFDQYDKAPCSEIGITTNKNAGIYQDKTTQEIQPSTRKNWGQEKSIDQIHDSCTAGCSWFFRFTQRFNMGGGAHWYYPDPDEDYTSTPFKPLTIENFQCSGTDLSNSEMKLYRRRDPASTSTPTCIDVPRCAPPNIPSDIDVPEALSTAWQAIKTQGYYTTRAELFTVLEVMQASNDPAVYAQCQAPSVTWGLLDRAQQYAWFEGTLNTQLASVSLQDIATHGPSGVRLHMFKEVQGLATSMHSNVLSEPDPSNPAHNFVHKHSIAQPYCDSNKDQLFTDDLSAHFQDVLFPMAHTVRVSPVSAYCSAWAVEHAIYHTLLEKLGTVDERTTQQLAIESTTRRRCQIQLEQIGICALRGVYEMPPSDADATPSCQWTAADVSAIACIASWTLPNCLYACKNTGVAVKFYDPLVSVATPLNFDPSTLASNPAVMLQSLHWPLEIAEDEAESATAAATLSLVASTITKSKSEGVDTSALLGQLYSEIQAHDTLITEGVFANNEFCNDLVDWWPGDAQHPVGYHPTTAATKHKTHVRGFDSWMSGYTGSTDNTDYAIDSRMRNSTKASRFFGAGNLVCDAQTYGRFMRRPKSQYLETQWSRESQFDPAVPGAAQVPSSWNTIGLNAEKRADHVPLLHAWEELDTENFVEDYLEHSVGLVRNWHRAFDTTEQSSIDSTWPAHSTQERSGAFGAVPGTRGAGVADERDLCSEHPLKTCTIDNQCNPLVCLMTTNEDDTTSSTGICAESGTCFAHHHCRNDELCAANGRCITPSLYIHNNLGATIAAQVFGGDDPASVESSDTRGLSEYQRMTDFAAVNGMCSLRNWQRHRALQDEQQDSDFTQQHFWVEMSEDTFTLNQKPHACDRSWQHTTLRALRPGADITSQLTSDGGALVNIQTIDFTRTFKKGTQGEDLHPVCDLRSVNEITGLISPYTYYNVNTHRYEYTLNNVRETVQRCSQYNLCPVLPFTIHGQRMAERRMLKTHRNPPPLDQAIYFSNSQTETHTTQHKYHCGAAGQLGPERQTCVLDQLVVPIASVVFRVAGLAATTDNQVVTGENVLAAVGTAASESSVANSKTETQIHCPNARDEIWSVFHNTLMQEFTPQIRQEVAWAANKLLPALFGLTFNDETHMMNYETGMTIEKYLEHVKCAKWLESQLEFVQNNIPNVYVSDPRFSQTRAGTALYAFHDRAHVELPFKWFWQCILINPLPDTSWMLKLGAYQTPDPTLANEQHRLTCNTDAALAERVTLHQFLRSSDYYLERDEKILTHHVEQLAQDVDRALARGLAVLNLEEFPRLQCLRFLNNRAGCNQETQNFNLFPYKYQDETTCWEKYGRNVNVPLPGSVKENPLQNQGLRAKARQFLFGSSYTTHEELMQATLSQLLDAGHIVVQDSLDVVIQSNSTYVPLLAFSDRFLPPITNLDVNSETIYTDTILLDNGLQYSTKTSVGDFCTPDHRLNNAEYARGQPPYPGTENGYYQMYDVENNVLRDLLNWFLVDIRTEPTFKSENLIRRGRIAGTLDPTKELDYTKAYQFNTRLSERTFECGNADELIEEKESNVAHASLRACVTGLQEPLAWLIPHKNTLEINPSAAVMRSGWFAGFSEQSVGSDSIEDRAYVLKNLVPNVDDFENLPTVDNYCYTDLARNRVEVLNPLWSGLFDLDSGCDLSIIGSGADRYHVIASAEGLTQPPHCVPNSRVNFARNGTLLSTLKPLCERQPDTETRCARRQGVFEGNLGESVSDLVRQYSVETRSGLFTASNSIFRQTRFTPKESDLTTALRYLPGDIGGHELHMRVSPAGHMELDCISLGGRISSNVRCISWLNQIENFWSYEHSRVRTAPISTMSQPWTCPLLLAAKWSGLTDEPAKQPNVARNRVRFKHITGTFDTVHPVVARRHKLKNLHPARFMFESQACLGDNCDIAVSDAVTALLDSNWRTFQYTIPSGASSCSTTLDWPHHDAVFRDGNDMFGDTQNSICRMHDRLPQFQVRTRDQDSQPLERIASTQPGGPCHMGRLQRIHVTDKTGKLQDCRKTPDKLSCRVWIPSSGTQTGKVHERETPTTTDSPNVPSYDRTERCRDIGPPAASFVLSDQNLASLNARNPLLSLGVPAQVSTARVLAGHLRRVFCPEAAEVCDVSQILGSSHWTLTDFLTELFKQASLLSVQKLVPRSTATDDEALWNRKWVSCKNNECKGSIDKTTWLDHTIRPTKCKLEIDHAIPSKQSTVDFCLLTSATEDLCNKVTEWRTELMGILCRASGSSECPDNGFFYSPTTFSLSNREFVHDTVQNFYRDVPGNECPTESEDTDAQVASNDALKQRCASSKIAPLKAVLVSLRDVKSMLIEIIYYAASVSGELLTLLVAVFSNQAELLRTAGDRLIIYIELFFTVIGEAVSEISRAIFATVFRDGLPAQIVQFLQELCAFMNWVHQTFIGTAPDKGVLCVVFNWLGNALQDFAELLDPVFVVPEAAVLVLNETGGVFLRILPCTDSEVSCDFLDEAEPEASTGALPAATRCSSSYQDFFGDTAPLSCTKADTCRKGLMDDSLQACVLCPTAPDNVRRFGCEPHTQICTCAVPIQQTTPCSHNEECFTASACKFVDNANNLAFGSTPCSTCAANRFCHVKDASSPGVCACGLEDIAFSSCGLNLIGQRTGFKADSMCLLTRSPFAEEELTTRADFGALASTPCRTVNPSSVFCSQILDSRGRVSGNFAVASRHLQGFRRRLLSDNTTNILWSMDSLSAACRDAATSPSLFTETLAGCERACSESVETTVALAEYEISLPPLTFCSLTDAVEAVKKNPLLPVQLMARPEAVRRVIFKHTPIRHAHEYYSALRTVVATYHHAFKKSQTVQKTANASHGKGRRLLQSETIARNERMDLMDAYGAFGDVGALHASYANTLSSITDSAYPALNTASPAQAVWLENWPPDYTQPSQGECHLLRRTLDVAEEAAKATALHFSTYPPAQPSERLADAWPTFESVEQNTGDTSRILDWWTQFFESVVDALLQLFGLRKSDVRGWVYGVLEGLPDWVRCDLERVQTCSGWKVKLTNASIVAGVYFLFIYVLLFQFNLSLVAVMLAPTFPLVVLYIAYGYSLMCVPLVPPCLILDVYQTLEAVVPVHIDLPILMYKDATCAHKSTVDANCLFSCQDAPWLYTSWEDPFAWILAELGQGAADIAFDVLQYVPFYDLDGPTNLRSVVAIKTALIEQNDPGVMLASRVCALTSSYLILPYAIIFMLFAVGGVAALVVATRLLMPAAMLFSSLLVAAFTE